MNLPLIISKLSHQMIIAPIQGNKFPSKRVICGVGEWRMRPGLCQTFRYPTAPCDTSIPNNFLSPYDSLVLAHKMYNFQSLQLSQHCQL